MGASKLDGSNNLARSYRFSHRKFFCRYRWVTILAVTPYAVIARHISVDISPSSVLRFVNFFRQPLGPQTAKRTLHQCVISALALSAHALLQLVRLQWSSEFMAGVLASLVGMKQHTLTVLSIQRPCTVIFLTSSHQVSATIPTPGEQTGPKPPRIRGTACRAGYHR